MNEVSRDAYQASSFIVAFRHCNRHHQALHGKREDMESSLYQEQAVYFINPQKPTHLKAAIHPLNMNDIIL